MVFGVTGNPKKAGIEEICTQILGIIERERTIFWEGLKPLLNKAELTYAKEEEIREKADIMITIGGDGTFLRTARAYIEKPILGVNAGTFGFLTVYSRENLERALISILSGNWSIEERATLKAILDTGSIMALNDLTVNVTGSARMLSIDVYVNGHQLFEYRGDGLIISTATGSTAYNLSAGGPILYPTMDAIVITPICPHKLSLRSVVVPPASEIAVSVTSKTEDIILSADGQEIIPLERGGTFRVVRNEENVKLVRTPDVMNPFEILKRKLNWG